ncbi:endonuclease domain-containing protein [Methylobacterium dankookense]|uniref:endonuclease domain-containing protein n=1 Tax=Methylobacterium dankookense TaxID=560405 RepID=UPI0011A888BD|nr:DUF559 domain-containing protein [Methylobacterium dankookense]
MPWNKPPERRVTARASAHATRLRQVPTEAERRLWWHLRHRLPIVGSHVRRQVPIGPYVADFCCLSARLIVEVDGDQHGSDASAAYDSRRDAYLQAEGFRVLRFSNRMVLREIDIVLDTIHAALAAAPASSLPDPAGQAEPPPPPAPSPQGGGEFAER